MFIARPRAVSRAVVRSRSPIHPFAMTLPLIAAALLLMAGAVAAGPQDADAGQALYAQHCATCHGLEGRGDGPMAGVLMIKPVNLSELSAANGGSFPLERVVKRIDGRDPLVSHGSPMPVYGDFFSYRTDEVKLQDDLATAQPVADLVAYLTSLQRAE